MIVIEQNKSGFERPGDVEFEDYSQGINRASSDSSLGTPKGPMDLLGKNRSKNFWLFSKRSKVGFSTRAKQCGLIESNEGGLTPTEGTLSRIVETAAYA